MNLKQETIKHIPVLISVKEYQSNDGDIFKPDEGKEWRIRDYDKDTYWMDTINFRYKGQLIGLSQQISSTYYWEAKGTRTIIISNQPKNWYLRERGFTIQEAIQKAKNRIDSEILPLLKK